MDIGIISGVDGPTSVYMVSSFGWSFAFGATKNHGDDSSGFPRFRSFPGSRARPPIWLNRRTARCVRIACFASLLRLASSLHLAQSSRCHAAACIARFASLLRTALICHWQGRCSGATGGASATEPWSSQGGYEECRG